MFYPFEKYLSYFSNICTVYKGKWVLNTDDTKRISKCDEKVVATYLLKDKSYKDIIADCIISNLYQYDKDKLNVYFNSGSNMPEQHEKRDFEENAIAIAIRNGIKDGISLVRLKFNILAQKECTAMKDAHNNCETQDLN